MLDDYPGLRPHTRKKRWATLVRRTERGWEVNRVARQVIEEIQQEWARGVGEDTLARLLQDLRRLARFLDEPTGPAGTPEINRAPLPRAERKTGRQ